MKLNHIWLPESIFRNHSQTENPNLYFSQQINKILVQIYSFEHFSGSIERNRSWVYIFIPRTGKV